jgi:hypothetical protein
MSQVGGGSSTFIEISPAGNLILTSPITGTASGSTTWTGAQSGCTFTPTATPATPYIQYTPTSGFVQFGYGSDGRLQLSNGTKAFSDVLTALDWAAPGAIGGTTAAGGAFTSLSASGTVSGTGFSTYLASPPAIGTTAAAAGSFTTLNSTSIPSAGPIGNTTPSTGKFTTATITTSLTINSGLLCSSTMPTVASGGGGTVAAAITGENTCSFSINVGTGTITNPLVLTFPAAVHGWAVQCDDITTTSTTNFITKQTGSVSTTSVTLTAYTDVATSSGTWSASDILECLAHAN